MKDKKISLAGDLGSGKSTVGKLLTQKYELKMLKLVLKIKNRNFNITPTIMGVFLIDRFFEGGINRQKTANLRLILKNLKKCFSFFCNYAIMTL